jgi:hypothetical protein
VFSTYNRADVSFAYPENWKLEEESGDDDALQVTISSPNTAFWTLAVYPDLHDPEGLAAQALEALREEYPDLETSAAFESVGEFELVGHDVDFFYLDLANVVKVRVCHRGESTLLLFSQSESSEAATAEPVFQAITTSLLTGTPTPDDD